MTGLYRARTFWFSSVVADVALRLGSNILSAGMFLSFHLRSVFTPRFTMSDFNICHMAVSLLAFGWCQVSVRMFALCDLEAPSWRGRFGFRIVPLLLAQDYNQAKKKPKKPAKTEDNADESEAPPRRKRSRRLRGRRLSRIPEVNGGTLGMTPQIFKHHWVILIFTVVGIVTMDWVCPGGSICIIDSTSDGVILLFASGSLLLQCSYLDSTWQSYTNSVTAGIIALLLRWR